MSQPYPFLGEAGDASSSTPFSTRRLLGTDIYSLGSHDEGVMMARNPESLRERIEEAARAEGVDLIGYADLTPARDFICKQGGEFLAEFPRAVSIGVRLLDGIVDRLHQQDDPSVIGTYLYHIRNVVNPLLDRAALRIGEEIQRSGYTAFAIPSSLTISGREDRGVISHKLAANLAGLGWIGKNCLLITLDHGPRLRLATVLTDALLETGAPLPNRCGDCRDCVDICPAKAFTGVPFNPSEPREARFKFELCSKHIRARELGCGLCMYVCPYGRKQT